MEGEERQVHRGIKGIPRTAPPTPNLPPPAVSESASLRSGLGCLPTSPGSPETREEVGTKEKSPTSGYPARPERSYMA